MKSKWIGTVAVFALAGGIIVWREVRRPRASAASPPLASAGARVVLFADLSETEEEEGCGAIIRGVRRVAERGIATLEIDARAASDLPARYRLLVAPTVVFLDGAGRETERYEGEAPETVRAIQLHLDGLVPQR